jgi:hypothetical protein
MEIKLFIDAHPCIQMVYYLYSEKDGKPGNELKLNKIQEK